MKQKTKKQGTYGESGKEVEGKKRWGLIEGTDGNNGERKKNQRFNQNLNAQWWRLISSPAKHNGNHELEL